MGSIEIQGKSGRIERVYFEVREFQLAQWNETQIKVLSLCVGRAGLVAGANVTIKSI